jgi:hypothetical protein
LKVTFSRREGREPAAHADDPRSAASDARGAPRLAGGGGGRRGARRPRCRPRGLGGAPPGWDVALREGHEFGRANNVEARLLFAAGEQTSSLAFRLDQLDVAEDTGQELLLRFEERDGIAKVARLTANGLDVELFHVLTFT